MSNEQEQYIDEQTGIVMMVERDVTPHPMIRISFTKYMPLDDLAELNAAMKRLHSLAGITSSAFLPAEQEVTP